jgi:HNH endonuclease
LRYWWVNQNQTYDQEIGGGYLWSPKRKTNNAFNHFYDTMRIVAPGDLVLSFKGTYIRAVGIAQACCYESPKPTEFGTAGSNWSLIGWRVDVKWTVIRNQIKPADFMSRLGPHLPDKYSPLRQNGHGLQSVYLTEIPQPMMLELASIIGYELLILMTPAAQPQTGLAHDKASEFDILKHTWENGLETEIANNETLEETEKESLVKSRRGQGKFRDRVQEIEKCCRITKVDKLEHLIASHCKPWRHCDNTERLDGENGLMLTPSIDHLFDRGFITFKDSGRLLISPVAHTPSLQRMGVAVDEIVNVGAFTDNQKVYLDFHRNDIFLETR